MLFTYDPSIHDYSEEEPELVCIGHDHYVYGSKKEIEEYKAIREKGIPVKSVTIAEPGTQTEETAAEQIEAPVAGADSILYTPIHDTGSLWYSFGAFPIPLLGLIVGWIFKSKHYYRNYKACRKGAIISLILLAAIIALFAIFLAFVYV